jgi:hypothetical protein
MRIAEAGVQSATVHPVIGCWGATEQMRSLINVCSNEIGCSMLSSKNYVGAGRISHSHRCGDKRRRVLTNGVECLTQDSARYCDLN